MSVIHCVTDLNLRKNRLRIKHTYWTELSRVSLNTTKCSRKIIFLYGWRVVLEGCLSLGEVVHEERQCCTKTLLRIDLIGSTLLWPSVVCMEDADLSTSTDQLLWAVVKLKMEMVCLHSKSSAFWNVSTSAVKHGRCSAFVICNPLFPSFTAAPHLVSEYLQIVSF